jgi:MFS family permease
MEKSTGTSSAYVILLCCVAAIGGFLFGFDSGVINGTVDALAKAFGTQAAGTGFAVASVLLGCAVGAFGAGNLADSLGRRPTMLLNAILFLASAVATGAANSAGFFIAARIFRGKRERAREIFARIGGDAKRLVRQVEESLKGEHRPRLSDLVIPGTRRLAPVLWVGMGLAAFQQFVGINIIFYYGEILWKAAGVTEQWALRINVLSGLVNILATIPAIVLIDRIGRKPLLLTGSVGMALTLGAMAIVFGTAGVGPDGKPLLSHMEAVAGLVAANLYIVAFGVSWGPVMWVLLGEMFPNQLRGAALAVSGATNWAANFAVTVTFLPLLSAVGLAGAYGFYAAAAAVSLPFVWAAVRETKGKTLEQMKDTTISKQSPVTLKSFV